MNNKRGGAGAIFVLVIILMLASAAGGAYAYRILDGKAAVNDAIKAVEDVDVSEYDTAEQSIIQGYIDETTKDLSTAKTRKEVYEILSDFISHVDKVQTKKEKELEQALKEAEDAKKNYDKKSSEMNTNNNSSSNSSTNSTSNSEGGSYKSNELTGGETEEREGNGLINSLLGGLASGSSGN